MTLSPRTIPIFYSSSVLKLKLSCDASLVLSMRLMVAEEEVYGEMKKRRVFSCFKTTHPLISILSF